MKKEESEYKIQEKQETIKEDPMKYLSEENKKIYNQGLKCV
jgi:hypothetical protein